jgi:putative flippase GtrA
MSHNSCDSNALAEMQSLSARADDAQASDSTKVTGAANSAASAFGDDFAHASLPNLNGVSEIRSWAVQPGAPFWRNSISSSEIQPGDSRECDENQVRKPEVARVSKFIRWIKFNAVGALGIGVQMAALFVLKSLLHLHYLVAAGCAVEAAVVHNFVWHERFTWVDRVRSATHGALNGALNGGLNAALNSSWRRLLRFNLTTGGVSIVGNLALMKLLAGMAHMNYFAANAIAIAICSLANFVASDEWVFEESTSSV